MKMFFLQFWWALLVFSSPGSTAATMDMDGNQKVSEQLESFSHAVDLAGPELQDLWSSFGGLQEFDSQMEQTRERRNTIDNALPKIAQSPIEGSKDNRNWQAEADFWYENRQAHIAKIAANMKRMSKKQQWSVTDSVTEEDMLLLKDGADAWYNDMMARKNKGANKKRSGGKEAINQNSQAVQRSETGKTKPKKAIDQKHEEPQSLSQAKTEAAPSQLDVNLKQTPQIVPDTVHLKQTPQTTGQQESESLQAQSLVKAKDMHEIIDDQLKKLIETKNALAASVAHESSQSNQQASPQANRLKLDHEANYKLSKIEQEAAEKLPKLPRAARQERETFKQKRRRYSAECDPMEEIRLKTSSRLIAKGFGPLLPSESLEIPRHKNKLINSKLVKSNEFHRTDNSDYTESKSSSATDADLPLSFDYKTPRSDRFHSLDQRKKANVLDYDRSKRKPKNLNIKSEPSLRTTSHVALSGQGLSLKQAFGEPLALDGQMKANRVRSLIQGEQYHRGPRRTRRVKRSLDNFEVLDNEVPIPDTEEEEELGGRYLSFPVHERESNHHDATMNQMILPNVAYHHHNHPHTSCFEAFTNFSEINMLEIYLDVQQIILQDLFEILKMNVDLLDPTKFLAKTQVARKLLRQYRALPILDNLVATDLMVEDLQALHKTASNLLHKERDAILDKVLIGVLDEYEHSKPSAGFTKFLEVAEILNEESDQQTSDDTLAFSQI